MGRAKRADGLTAEEELEKVSAAMHVFVRDQYKCWNEETFPALAKQSIRVLSLHELDAKGARTAKIRWVAHHQNDGYKGSNCPVPCLLALEGARAHLQL